MDLNYIGFTRHSPVDEGFMTKNTITRDVAIQKIFFQDSGLIMLLKISANDRKPPKNIKCIPSYQIKMSPSWNILHINLSTPIPKRKSINPTNFSICMLLLVLSNDINPNPGPKQNEATPKEIKCFTCKDEISVNYLYLKCQNCSNQYHITCQKTNRHHFTNY